MQIANPDRRSALPVKIGRSGPKKKKLFSRAVELEPKHPGTGNGGTAPASQNKFNTSALPQYPSIVKLFLVVLVMRYICSCFSTDMKWFEHIVPCGIVGKGVTSLSREVGRLVSPAEAAPHLLTAFRTVLATDLENFTSAEVDALLASVP